MKNLDTICTIGVQELTNEQLERAAEVFILEGTSFAVSQGTLWMSENSLEFFRVRAAYILTGP